MRGYSSRFLDYARNDKYYARNDEYYARNDEFYTRNDEFTSGHSLPRATACHGVAFGEAGSSVVCRPSSSLPYWSLPIFPDRLGTVGFYHLGDLGGGAVIVDLELFGCVCPG